MDEIIQHFTESPVIASFVIGLLLLIGAITKGGISLGAFEIPAIEAERAKYLGALGFACIILAFFLAWKPWEKNTPPEASTHTEVIQLPRKDTILTRSIDMAEHIGDADNDTLRVSILDSNLPGGSSIKGNILTYKVDRDGEFKITYQVTDGKDQAVSDIKIKVNLPVVKLATRKGQLINIFGIPKKGKYSTDLENIKESSAEKIIIANEKGLFKLTTQEEEELCHIYIQKDSAEFFLNYESGLDTVEYKPLDTIEIVFCNSYDKNERKPDSLVFENRFKIPFEKLNITTEPNGQMDSLNYGELFLSVKYFGYFSADNKGTLDFYFIQKTGDKTTYDPVEITSNSSPSGWRSYVKKKLLKGEYDLIIKSKNGTELEKIEFEII